MHQKSEGACEEDGWLRFDLVIDLKDIHITGFREWVLFDKENNPQRCVWVFFSDGDSAYACYSMATFEKIYNGEYKDIYMAWWVSENIEVQPEPEPKKKKWWQF